MSLRRAVTIPEVLRDAGYFTAMTGKRHLSKQPTDLYGRNLRELVGRLKATGARLIFATTTPVPNGGILAPDRRFGDPGARGRGERRGGAREPLTPMKRKTLASWALALSAALSVPAAAAPASDPRPARPPNIVIVLIDDLGYGDIGPFGATRQRTPHLDRMAREGMRLTSFYSAPVCSVARAQLLTGCYGARVSVPGVFGPGSRAGLHPREITIAERLKERGYATACVGKWHVGDQPEFLPTRQGFDRYFGIPYSNDMQRAAAETGERVVPLLRDEKVLELLTEERQGGIVERYTAEALDFIRASRGRPFFLYLPHTAVHTPIHPGAAFAGRSANGRFGDWVEEVDWSVGRILDTLRDLGLDRETLVLFTSDNGPWLIKGADGGCALPLRGGKGSTWEGGVRVPTLAWWPGKIPAGSACDAVAGTIDLLPTAVALAGGALPESPVIDGRDISALLRGESAVSAREAHYYFSGYNLQAIRQGPWKLAVMPQRDSLSKSPGADTAKNPRLYDLDREIGEVTDLSGAHPDIVARLQALLDRMNAEVGGENPRARRPPGEVEHPQTLYPSEAPKAKAKRARAPGQTTPPTTAPADLGQLKPGDAVSGDAAPRVAHRPFTLSCTVAAAPPDGVILAHGGSAVGYALHARGGRAVFTVSNGGKQASIEDAVPASGGAQRIVASIGAGGVMRLQIGERPPVTGSGIGLLARQPQEDFCVGHDNRRPVTTYATGGSWRGGVTDLEFASP